MLNHEAVLLKRDNRVDAAITKVKAAIDVYPFDSTYFYNYGNYLSAKKNFSEATMQYQKAIALEPRDFDSLYNLGLAYRGLKNNKMAEAAYRKALAIRPEDFDTVYNLGNVLRDELRFEESRAMYERASRLPGASSQRMSEAYRMLDDKINKNRGAKL
ncbi:MAG: tetratricopeptide repeat protein [Candidatus Obscuribacterales bacterium]|nr:tetratricopeptide repeat protein [Candidatus Obscuribacterales bacterium]